MPPLRPAPDKGGTKFARFVSFVVTLRLLQTGSQGQADKVNFHEIEPFVTAAPARIEAQLMPSDGLGALYLIKAGAAIRANPLYTAPIPQRR